jgi:transcriptional regulator with XRE-family HTH domain
MARSALLWTLRDLSDRSGVSVATITRFETDESQKRRTNRTNLMALRRAFEAGGAVFVDDGNEFIGVKIHKRTTDIIEKKESEVVNHGDYTQSRFNDHPY